MKLQLLYKIETYYFQVNTKVEFSIILYNLEYDTQVILKRFLLLIFHGVEKEIIY